MAKAFPSNPTGARRNGKSSVSSNQPVFVGETVAVTAAQAGTLNQLVGTLRLPKGAEIIGAFLKSDDLDSNGAPAILMTMGDAADDDRYVASTNIGQAGGFTATLDKAGAAFMTTDETLVQVKFKTAAATGQAGNIQYGLWYVTNG